MKKTLMAAMTSLLLVTGSAFSADFGCGSCCDEGSIFQGGLFYAQGEWLWWKLRRCDLDYALPFIVTNSGNFDALGPTNYRSIHPSYTSGWRVAAGYETCGGYDLRLRYTHYDTGEHDRISGAELFIPTRSVVALAPVTALDAKYNFELHNVDLELGSVTHDCCNSYTRLFIGAQFTSIEERFLVTYGTTNAYVTNNHLDLNAWGLRTGFEYHRDLGSCLGVFVNGSLSLLAGSYDLTLSEGIQFAPTLTVDVCDHPHCFLGQVALAAGLDYIFFKGSCSFAALSFGYELQSWYNTADFLTLNALFTEGLETIRPARNHSNIGLDGIVLRLTAGY